MLSKKQITLLFFVVLTFAIATPSFAWTANTLNDSQEPGSVVVFPLFERGTVACPADAPYGCTPVTGTLPRTSFEISVVCPNGATCTDQQDVDIHFEWVCGGPGVGLYCAERNFTLNTTVNGTIRFSANGGTCQPAPGFTNPEGCGTIPVPQCFEGYLIAWVVNESGQPIKFDGLIGDAVLRESSTAVTAYNAIPIQAAPALATGALVPLGPSGALRFDGTGYAEVTGTIVGSLQLDFVNPAGSDQDQTSLVLLTLDTLSNRFNFPVDVDLNFYNEGEQPFSNPFEFTCVAETGSLFSTFGLESSISPGTGKALVQSIRAEKTPVLGITDTAGPVTLLGLVITRECDPAAAACSTFVPGVGVEPTPLRTFAYPLLNDSIPVPTSFKP